MPSPPPSQKFDQPCAYIRKRRGTDDFICQAGEFMIVSHGCLALAPTSGTDVEIADGLENIVTYEAWDRWHPAIQPSDQVELHDGRKLSIRRLANWEERNEYWWMTLIYRVPEVAFDG